jgi:hypothetical protein
MCYNIGTVNVNQVPKEAFMDIINRFLEAAKTDSLTWELTQEAVQKFQKDLLAVGDTEVERRAFYQEYYEFAKTCGSKGALGGVSGYGRGDFVKLRIKDLCRLVDYNFPYGWK